MRVFLLLLVAGACASPRATPSPAPSSPAWITTLHQDHPLVGRILDTRTGKFIIPSAIPPLLTNADVVLLGEKHDNPDHHRLQAQVLGMMVEQGLRPSVALEMVDVDQQSSVDSYLAHPQATARGFGHAVQWTERGWPDFSMYEPIFSLVMQHKLPLLAANAPTAMVRNLARQGRDAITDAEWQALGLDEPLPASLHQALITELKDSHCGMLPERALEPMALAQRARDAQMALRLLDAHPPVALVAGAGHARLDRGVPLALRRTKPDLRVRSLAFMEVIAGRHGAPEYLDSPSSPEFDLLWFTPRVDDEDPCKGMKR